MGANLIIDFLYVFSWSWFGFESGWRRGSSASPFIHSYSRMLRQTRLSLTLLFINPSACRNCMFDLFIQPRTFVVGVGDLTRSTRKKLRKASKVSSFSFFYFCAVWLLSTKEFEKRGKTKEKILTFILENVEALTSKTIWSKILTFST